MWYRAFSPTLEIIPPAALAEHLQSLGLAAVPHFKGDELGWTTGEFHLPGNGSPILLAAFRTKEDDLRDDLNSYAAELESMTLSPEAGPLMEKVIQTKQLFTIRKPVDAADEIRLERTCEALAQFLATASNGFYQIDRKGWYSADGRLMVEEY